MKDWDLPLGRPTSYPSGFAPDLLRAVPRQALVRADTHGADHWTAHEFYWLDDAGAPHCAVLELRIPSDSPSFVESKSLKLYLGSFAVSLWESPETIGLRIADDLATHCGGPVEIALVALAAHATRERDAAGLGENIDVELAANVVLWTEVRRPRVEPAGPVVHERLHSHLLRSLCPVTGQPDLATIVIDYKGCAIDRAALLSYLVCFRDEACFHEQLIERIYAELLGQCAPSELTVMGLFCRRGGIDIVPVRSTRAWPSWPPRSPRQ